MSAPAASGSPRPADRPSTDTEDDQHNQNHQADQVDRPVPLRTVFATARGHRGSIGVALLAALAGSALGLAQPALALRAIDAARHGRSIGTLVGLLGMAFFGQAVTETLAHYLLERSSEGIVLGLRRGLVGRLLRVRMAVFDRQRLGDLLSRVNTDTALLRDVVAYGSVDVASGALMILGGVAFMLWLDPLLFGLVALTVGLAGGGAMLVLARIRVATEQAQDSVGELSADLERALGAIRTVRASRTEEREEARILTRATAAWRAGVRAAKLDSIVSPAIELAANGSFIIVLVCGGVRVAHGSISIERFAAFLLYLSYLAVPISGLFQAADLVQRGRAALRRVQAVLDMPVESDDRLVRPARASDGRSARPAPTAPVPVLQFEDVWFGYPERQVLRGVSFTVPSRGQVALVGPSGAGKSTILALTSRFYDPRRGVIRLDGLDVMTELDRAECRGRLGLVEQDAPVLHGSLRDNLTYGAPGASAADIDWVLELTSLTELVERLPAGLDTAVGDRGTLLSGGERQRLAIARALLPRPRLLLLDEPTSQLDPVNEVAMARAIERLATETATLVVAHRLSTVRRADQIIVLEAGMVAAVGGHAELLTSSSVYRRLAAAHFQTPVA
jgi:ABC-type multidrug transport system fused ATPase/permease subunit